tara:strand:+ start:9244 stop:13269 length:4026 start_codon:yes stop_codon:yes gene_type:complete
MVEFKIPPPPHEEVNKFKIPPPPEANDITQQNITANGFVLPPVPEKNQKLSEAELKENPEWIRAAKSIYEWNEGRNSKEVKKLNSDKEYADYALRYMGWFNYNIPKMGKEALDLKTNANQQQREDFVSLMDMYDNKKASLAGTKRLVKGLAFDPSTYVGIGTFGAGLVAREGAKQTAKQGIKELVKEGAKQGAKIGAIEGATYSTVDNALRQSARLMSGQQEGFDLGQSAKAATLGAGLGGALGGTIGGAASFVKNKNTVPAQVNEMVGPMLEVPQRKVETLVEPEVVTPKVETPVQERSPFAKVVNDIESGDKPNYALYDDDPLEFAKNQARATRDFVAGYKLDRKTTYKDYLDSFDETAEQIQSAINKGDTSYLSKTDFSFYNKSPKKFEEQLEKITKGKNYKDFVNQPKAQITQPPLPKVETPKPKSNKLPDILIPPKEPKIQRVNSLLYRGVPMNDPGLEEIASALGYSTDTLPLVYKSKNAKTSAATGEAISDTADNLAELLGELGFARNVPGGKLTPQEALDILESNPVLPEFEDAFIKYDTALRNYDEVEGAFRRAGINLENFRGKTNQEVDDVYKEIIDIESTGVATPESFGERFDPSPPVESYADEIAAARTINDISPDGKDFQTDTTVDLNDRLVEVGIKIMDDLEIPRNPNVRISDQLEEVLFQAEGNPVAREKLDTVLKNNNITLPQLSQLFRGSIADSARRMQKLSSVSRSIQNLSEKIGKTAKPETWTAKLYNFIKQADNIRRGLLVSQIATAMRNNTAQLGRVSMKTMIDVFDNTLKKTFNPLRKAFGAEEAPVDYARSFELILNLTKNKKQAKDLTDLLTKYYVKDAENLFTRYSSDVADATKTSNASRVIKVGQKVTDGLNILNRMQEFWYRRAVFANNITDALLKKGIDINKVGISDDLLKYVNKADIEKAVDDALYFTYAKTPDVPIIKSLVDAVNKSPFLLTGVIPFPRFMANAIAFQFRHSPLGFSALLTPKEIAKLKAGDYKTLSQAVVGTTLLLTMIEAKRKGMSEEHKWYELETSSGKTIDMRPYFPLTPYLLVADMVVRSENGRGAPDAKDVLQGLSGAQFRAGASVQLVQNLLDGMAGLDTEEKVNKFMSDYTANVLGGYMTPIRMFGDFVDQDQQFRRPLPTGEFLTDTTNQLKSNIPFVRDQFPESESPTREATPGRPDTVQIPFTDIEAPGPLVRQLTGATVREEKNAAEREFDRLGFKRRDILPYSGNAVVDQTRAKYLGPLVETVIPVIIQSEQYQSASNELKTVILRKTLTEIRGAANDYIKQNKINEKQFAKAAFNRQPKYIKALLNSKGITSETLLQNYVSQDRADR